MEKANKKAFTFDPTRPVPSASRTDEILELGFTEVGIVIAKRILGKLAWIPNPWIARFVAEIYNGLHRRDPAAAEDILNGFNAFIDAPVSEIKKNLEEARRLKPKDFHPHYTHVEDIQSWLRTIRSLAVPMIPSLNEE